MGRDGGRALSKRVDAVREGVEAWRSQRPKPAAMPEELWSAAVALAREHGVYAIARSLRLDYGTLKRRLAEAGEASWSEEEAAGEFVEVQGAQPVAERETTGTVVELTHADGSRMVVRLPAPGALDLVGLATAFWGRRA